VRKFPTAHLAEVASVNWGDTSVTKASYAGTGYPAYSATGCDGLLSGFQHDSEGIILSAIGAKCGKCFYANGKWTAIKNTITITPHESIQANFRFLFHLLNREELWPRRGVGQPFIGLADARKLGLPFPALPQQRRIAAILDKADDLRTKRRAALAQLDSLTQSIFLEMFGDPATNPKGWSEEVSLGDVSDIVSGVTKGRQLNGKVTRNVPYLAVINVQDRSLNLAMVKTIEATEEEIERYRLQKGDLLLTEGGDPDKLGRGTLWGDELPVCIHQNHVFRVRLTSSVVEPLFLEWLIGSARGKRYFLRSAKQTTGIATINMTQLRGFPLLLPPVKLQREFARRLAAVECVKSAQRKSLANLNAAFSSLQHRAFRGEL